MNDHGIHAPRVQNDMKWIMLAPILIGAILVLAIFWAPRHTDRPPGWVINRTPTAVAGLTPVFYTPSDMKITNPSSRNAKTTAYDVMRGYRKIGKLCLTVPPPATTADFDPQYICEQGRSQTILGEGEAEFTFAAEDPRDAEVMWIIKRIMRSVHLERQTR